jgi:hypothetical protein
MTAAAKSTPVLKSLKDSCGTADLGKADVIGEAGKCTLSATEEADRLDEALRTGRPVGHCMGFPLSSRTTLTLGLAKASLSEFTRGIADDINSVILILIRQAAASAEQR